MSDDILSNLHDEQLKTQCKALAEENGWTLDIAYVAVKAGAEHAVPIISKALASAGKFNTQNHNVSEIAKLQEELSKVGNGANPLCAKRNRGLSAGLHASA